jgi:hypothetical protein
MDFAGDDSVDAAMGGKVIGGCEVEGEGAAIVSRLLGMEEGAKGRKADLGKERKTRRRVCALFLGSRAGGETSFL